MLARPTDTPDRFDPAATVGLGGACLAVIEPPSVEAPVAGVTNYGIEIPASHRVGVGRPRGLRSCPHGMCGRRRMSQVLREPTLSQ
jgi:hypothetical protein